MTTDAVHWSQDVDGVSSAFIGDTEIGFITDDGHAYVRKLLVSPAYRGKTEFRCVARDRSASEEVDVIAALRAIVLMAAGAECLAESMRASKVASMYTQEGLPIHAQYSLDRSDRSFEMHKVAVAALDMMCLPKTWLSDNADLIVETWKSEQAEQ